MTCLIISYLGGAGDQSVGVLIFTKPRSWAFSSSIISTNFGIEESCLAVGSNTMMPSMYQMRLSLSLDMAMVIQYLKFFFGQLKLKEAQIIHINVTLRLLCLSKFSVQCLRMSRITTAFVGSVSAASIYILPSSSIIRVTDTSRQKSWRCPEDW